MKLIDFDALAVEYLKKKLKGAAALPPDEMDDAVANAYAKFGDEKLDELGGKTPNDYFSGMKAYELCDLLEEYIEEEVPVPEYLVTAIVGADTEKFLLKFLEEGTDEELFSYAVNILSDKNSIKPLGRYLEILRDPTADENVRELVGEKVIEGAANIKEELIEAANDDTSGDVIAEALSTLARDDRILDILIDKFNKTKNLQFYANLLARYGDERAVPAIKARMDDKLRFADYRELKSAVEALGGEVEDKRDFSADYTYRKIKGEKDK